MVIFEKYSKPNCIVPSYIEIKKSKIPGAGDGAFALCDIPANSKIGEYLGKVYTNPEEYDKLGGDYLFEIQDNGKIIKVIDGKMKKYSSWVRYVNTCQDDTYKGCNAQFYQYDKRMFLKTLKMIPAGQEIYAYYGHDYIVNKLRKFFTKENKPVIITKKSGKKCKI